MITWWIALHATTKAYLVTVTLIVVWSVGLQWLQVKYLGSGWWA